MAAGTGDAVLHEAVTVATGEAVLEDRHPWTAPTMATASAAKVESAPGNVANGDGKMMT